MKRAALVLLVTACVSQQPQYGVSPTVLTQRVLRGVIEAAISADSGGVGVDTLFMVGATVVADGHVRVNHPFFAGVSRDGSVTLTGYQAEIASGLAWAIVDYRWVAKDGRRGTFARATIVLEPHGDGWQIKHVHSSTAQP